MSFAAAKIAFREEPAADGGGGGGPSGVQSQDPRWRSSLLAWFDPRNTVVDASGRVVRASNRALGREAHPFTAVGRGPVWSATALNGTPGIVCGSPTAKTVLQAIINPVMGDPLGSLAWPCTIVAACNPPVSSLNAMMVTTSNGSNVNSGLQVFARNGQFAFDQFDDADQDLGDVDAPLPQVLGPQIMTCVADGAGTFTLRSNGQTRAVVGINLLSTTTQVQQFLSLGGQSDEVDAAFPPVWFEGVLGTCFVLAEALEGADLEYYEGLANAASGRLYG